MMLRVEPQAEGPREPAGRSQPRPPGQGFTLVELMTAMGMAMVITTVVLSALMQFWRASDRVTVRLAMHSKAALVVDQLSFHLTALQQHTALVAEWVDVGAAGSPDPRMRLLFMRGVFDQNNWDYSSYSDYPTWPMPTSTDLVWELWEWRASNHCLYSATNGQLPRHASGTLPNGSHLNINGVDYGNLDFINLPQPHRLLPLPWQASLNANMLFPTVPGNLATSPSMIPGDVGDWTDLSNNLVPVLTGVSTDAQDPANPASWDGVTDFGIQLRLRNGTVREFTTASAYGTLVIPGVRIDGRPGPTDGDGAQTLADANISGPGLRPDLVRLRWMMRDRRTNTQVPFSFSFPLPGFAVSP